MSIETIYSQLIAAGLSSAGACALMGNMQAESGMKANIAQRGMTKYCDEDYTALADNNGIDFVHDAVGYGLCQWTYHTRKAALLAFAKAKCVSVGDEEMQVEFCMEELKSDYRRLYNYLCDATDMRDAAYRICTEYERPAVNNVDERYRFAQEFCRRFGDGVYPQTIKADTSKQSDMLIVNRGDYTPEAQYLAALLRQRGYDVLWDGLWACLRDYQQKTGLKVDGVCGEKTWKKLLEK